MGDATKGKLIATNRRCLLCHSVNGGGEELLGPDLSHTWDALGRDGVIESIREPSKVIATGYEGYEIVTADGQSNFGRLLGHDEHDLNFRTVERVMKIPNAAIRKITPQKISLMPAGLLEGLSDTEQNDLLAYLQSLSQPDPVVRVQVGGEGGTFDRAHWEIDREYSPGGYGAIGGKPYENNAVLNKIVSSCRSARQFSYRIDLDDGDYEITLELGEPYFHEAGKRVFSVKLQNELVIKEIDLIRDAGFGIPVQKAFRVKVTNGRIDLDFIGTVDEALLNAIEVRLMDPSNTAPAH